MANLSKLAMAERDRDEYHYQRDLHMEAANKAEAELAALRAELAALRAELAALRAELAQARERMWYIKPNAQGADIHLRGLTWEQYATELVVMLHNSQKRAEAAEAQLAALEAACIGFLNYRHRSGAMHFQLEKADDYFRLIEQLVVPVIEHPAEVERRVRAALLPGAEKGGAK